MKTKHTPGPWHVSDNNVQWEILNENKNEIACVLTSDIPNDDEIFANAKLIATAPKLLEALQNLLTWREGTINHNRAIKDAEELIKKATE